MSSSASTVDQCFFNGCMKPVVRGTNKCSFHKNRDKCRTNGCHNQVYARGLCVRHGGKKQCAFEGCEGNARSGAFCCRHGQPTKKKLCQVQGCIKVAHANHKCVAHGGGRKCKMENCSSHARQGGLCQRHRIETGASSPKSWDAATFDFDFSDAVKWLEEPSSMVAWTEIDFDCFGDESAVDTHDLDKMVLDSILYSSSAALHPCV
ncbi:unnamed protein product [Aphanomyces euteiches]|uniref:Uncharacterized protein n=1 Tax=Aphanomyces euteiches TaxID=100861 RepID=A0A6G0WQ65_9STRA|nr:hypothetical protein Ae201684_012828 [Aphanomyces euteiches]KAH9097585.1 hypothetical protein Ae201684P_001061 [Aphanomyces euteiches]KAH9145286.1 hypothetical protein AeRB84_010780 [Aphanomyces euteiches]